MKKIYYVLIGVLILLIITNPSIKAFKEYLGVQSFNGLRRSVNFFIVSIYKSDEGEYIAVIGNFSKIKTYPKKIVTNSILRVIPIYERYPKQMARRIIYETLLHNGYTITNFGSFPQFCKDSFSNDLNTSIVYQFVNPLGTDNYGTQKEFVKNLSDNR